MTSALHDTLSRFAHHVRDPHHRPRPEGLPARATAVYGELLFNNLVGFLDACFPVCRQMLGEPRWRRLNRTFFRDWPGETPWFREIPRDFQVYVSRNAQALRLPRWLPQLAHYEWVELAVDVMDPPEPVFRADGDLTQGTVVVNPAMMNLAYPWPVHLIGPAYRPQRPVPTQLAVFRNHRDEVEFTLLNAGSSRLLDILIEQPITGEAAILRLAGDLHYPAPEKLLDFGRQFLHSLRQSGLILGVTP